MHGPRSSLCRVLYGGLVTLACLTAFPGAVAGQDVTFTAHVAPILHRSCVNCHRPGSIAPMSLVTYEDARPWARAIKEKTSRSPDDPERMPPWFIEKNVGVQAFKDDPSLTDDEIRTIAAWADAGAPRGDPADMPEIDLAGREWSIGTPDLIVSSPSMTIPAVAPDFYGRVGPAPTGLIEDRYVKAVEFREVRHDDNVVDGGSATAERTAGDLNYFVVHHAVIGASTDAGGTAESRASGRFNVVWELGQNSTIYPDVLGVKLAAGSALNFDLHTHSIGTETTFSIEVAFVLHPQGYQPKYTNAGSFNSLTYDLDIPGNQETVIEALWPLSRPGLVLSFEPHLHSSGRRMCVEALYPTGYQETLNCAGYNHNWVKVYHYQDDVAPLLPAGTVLKVTAWYDNTAANPRVADPRNWKGWGSRSIDDMMFLLSRVIWLTEEEYEAEAAARDNKSAVTTQEGN
ncbi:MAG: hypothetical protein VYE68_01425 [Acidobacteriota bacterium]|nr:hypothetical protein [Acidobacteriota bacterium]